MGMGLVAGEAVSAADLVDGHAPARRGRRGSRGHGVLLVDKAYYLYAANDRNTAK